MAQARDGRDLLDTYQPGNRASSQRIVRTYQNEVVRNCFLLTGDAVQAVRLARLAFLDFFRTLMRGDIADDPRESLLGSAVRRWRAGDHRKVASSSGDVGGSGAGPEQHYHVDDERSRVVDALGRLSPTAQAGLVLREFNLLDEEAVCRILDTVPHELRREIQPARTKIQEVSGDSVGRSARELLIDAATVAPRPDLWAELEGSLDELQQEEQERRQRYTYLAAGLVGLALLGAAFWLFDLLPASGDDSPAAAVATSTATAEPTASPEPSPTPVPVPDIADLELPRADVPARLLVWATGNQSQREIGLYDPASTELTAFNDAARGFPKISPDGRLLIDSWVDLDNPEDPSEAVIAMDSATGETVWEASLSDGGAVVAVTTDAVYISVSASFAWDLIAFDLETGEEVDRREDLQEELGFDSTFLIQRTFRVSPDGKRLFVALDERQTTSEPGIRLLASFRLPEMTLESVNRQTSRSDDGQFDGLPFSGMRVTPDGEYVYAVSEGAVRFRSSELNERLDLELPFSTAAAGEEHDLRWVTSNDGRFLYIVSITRQEVAIVDLLGRRLVRAFPIDPGEFGSPGQPTLLPVQGAPGTFIGATEAAITLSQDGSQLYLVGGLPGAEGGLSEDASLVWVIEVATWRVIERWEMPGLPMHLAAIGDELYAHSFFTSIHQDPEATEPSSQLVALDVHTGEVRPRDEVIELPEWVTSLWAYGLPEWYRAEYGRLPMVENVVREDVQLESTLPRVDVDASDDTVPIGGTVEIEARMIDPATGDHLTADRSGVRFDPESTAVIRLRHEAGAVEDIVLIPTSNESGVYRASATIEETGYWSAELTLTAANGTSWTVWNQRVFESVPSFEATDDKRYILDIETDPAEPGIEQEVPVTARFVEVKSGDLLPVTADLLEGAPDEMRLTFVVPQQGATSATVERLEDGSYEGTIMFRTPGVWTAEATFTLRDGDNVRVGAGTVTVGWN